MQIILYYHPDHCMLTPAASASVVRSSDGCGAVAGWELTAWWLWGGIGIAFGEVEQ